MPSAKNSELLPLSPNANKDAEESMGEAIAASALQHAIIADAELVPSLAWAKLDLKTVGPGENLVTLTTMELAIPTRNLLLPPHPQPQLAMTMSKTRAKVALTAADHAVHAQLVMIMSRIKTKLVLTVADLPATHVRLVMIKCRTRMKLAKTAVGLYAMHAQQ